jgi:regulator of sirC expression with transglutaminase-like and TPR domain
MVEEEKIREINALMRLMDEPDAAIFEQVSARISSFGNFALPFLENEWEASGNTLVQKRVEKLITEIQFLEVRTEFRLWIDDGCKNLLEACLIIARMGSPELSEQGVRQELARIRKDIWLEINENLTALEQIRVFNHVFYDIHGFTGNAEAIHSPDNSFIDRVLAERKGNPLSLAIVYLLIAQSLDIPVFGVNLPEHFVLAYVGNAGDAGGSGDTGEEGMSAVLFYINAFSNGTVFSRRDVAEFIQRLGHQPKTRYLEPCGNKDIIARLLNNLLNAYFKEGNSLRAEQVEDLRKILAG